MCAKSKHTITALIRLNAAAFIIFRDLIAAFIRVRRLIE